MADAHSSFLIADDHPVFRDALRNIVEGLFPRCIIHEANNYETLVDTISHHPAIDLILLDLNMPGMNGLSGVVSVRNTAPAIPVIVVTAEEKDTIMREVASRGAAGFIRKSTPREAIADAITAVMAGEVYFPKSPDSATSASAAGDTGRDTELSQKIATLTEKQRRVLELVAMGMTNKVIAFELNVTESTVKAHVSAILKHLNVYNRAQIVLLMNRQQGEGDSGSA